MSPKKSDTAVAEAPASRHGGLSATLRANARWLVFVGVFVARLRGGLEDAVGAVREQVISAADYRIDAGTDRNHRRCRPGFIPI